jgi:hypothetical protein
MSSVFVNEVPDPNDEVFNPIVEVKNIKNAVFWHNLLFFLPFFRLFEAGGVLKCLVNYFVFASA